MTIKITMEENLMRVNATASPPENDLLILPYRWEFELVLSISAPIQFALLLAGLFSNAVNVIVFTQSGAKDSVTILLLALSISDGTFLLLFTPSTVFSAFAPFGLMNLPAAFVTHHVLFWPAFTLYDFSCYISVFLGVTRCACVAMPLKFKTVFSPRRTLLALCILFCTVVLLNLPVLSIYRLGFVTDPLTNSTSLSLVSDNYSLQMYKLKINDILNKNIIPWTTFIIMVACVALLSFKLIESTKIRSNHRHISQQPGTNNAVAQATKLSPKDLKVVQSVVLVCSIFMAAQLPSMIYSTVRSSNQDLTERGRLVFLSAICIYITYTFSFLNASVNIFVYYNYNTKYRSTFRSMFNLKKSEET